MDWSDDLALIRAAAREAGEVALSYFGQSPEVWWKNEGRSPVSAADFASNERLHGILRAARPDYGWLSEESEADPSRLDAQHCFIIDPIDGTRAFIDGQDSFAHSLAVAQGDRIVAAAVYLPARDLCYTASVDGPALLNGAPIAPSRHAMQGARVLTYRAATDPGHWRGGQPPPFRREFRPSLAWRLCLAAQGRFDAALSLRAVWEWDIAAGSLIAERAGAMVSDRRGGRMRFNSPRAMIDGLIVAGSPLHGQLLEALAPEDTAPGAGQA